MQDSFGFGIVYSFGRFQLVPDRQLLVREGRPLKLSSRALAILHFLLEHAGKEVSKEELIHHAWPDVFVEESNLKVHISGLRRALDDTFPRPSLIATVAGRGYKFVGSVKRERTSMKLDAGLEPERGRNFPVYLAPIAREADLAQLVQSLEGGGLVTLTGPGGVGKTCLATAVARASLGSFSGAYFVDLSAVANPALVPHLIASAIGIRCAPGEVLPALISHLQKERLLLVLDNCEHVLHETAAVATALLQSNTRSSVLATSREALGVRREKVHQVKPLSFPANPGALSLKEALSFPAVALFASRALSATGYRLHEADMPDVSTLCGLLDGMPLPIEIVAAKLQEFTPGALLEAVRNRLNDLRNENENAPDRHKTMWTLLDWSCQLLSEEEATLFRLLSVFTGSFKWADVVVMSRIRAFSSYDTAKALSGLVAKSLLVADDDGEQFRYRFLSSFRAYAAERLEAYPYCAAANRAHAEIVLSILKRAEREWPWADSRLWRAEYERLNGDLRKSLDWCFGDDGDPGLGVEIAIFAIRLWNEQSSIFEQRFQTERALSSASLLSAALAKQAALAIARAWSMTLSRQPLDQTEPAWSAALGYVERSEDEGQRLALLCSHSVFLIYTGQNRKASYCLEYLIRAAEEAEDWALAFDAQRLNCFAQLHLGKIMEARMHLERLARELVRGAAPSRVTRYGLQRDVSVHTTLAFSVWLMGESSRAFSMTEELLARTSQARQLMGQANVLALVALPLAFLSGNFDQVERYSQILRAVLDQENIAIWEPVQQFYAAALRSQAGGEDAIESMMECVNTLRADGITIRVPMYVGIVAEALLASGRVQEAEGMLTGLTGRESLLEERWCQPELLRVQASLCSAQSDRRRAALILKQAQMLASSMGVRALEVRVARDLALLSRGQEDDNDSLEQTDLLLSDANELEPRQD